MISRFSGELATAAGTAAMGGVITVGALEFGVGWESTGPEPGAFPFYVGVVIMLASLATAVQTVLQHQTLEGRIFLDGPRLRRISIFFALVAGFVFLSAQLGLYVAAVLYVTVAVWWQGAYRLWVGPACGVATAVFFYIVLEWGFQVPLMKGPLEAALGIY